jgi:predicted component of type VI protein secretion system
MALTLIVRSGDLTPAPELTFDAPRLVVGRRAGSDLRLPDPSVSQRHASLRQRGSEYTLVDEASDNGSFVGSKEIAPHAAQPLKDGDLLRFGRVWVEVRLNTQKPVSAAGESVELARRLVEHALGADERPCAAQLVVEAGPLEGHTTELASGRSWLVGPQAAADWVLTDEKGPQPEVEISRHAAGELCLVRRGADGVARLKGRALKAAERVPWPADTTLELGDNRLRYSDPVALALAELEQSDTERLGPLDTIAPPNGARPDASQLLAAKVAASPEPKPAAARPLAARKPGAWTPADAVVVLLCVSVLCLSLWAISWLSHVPSLSERFLL